jgi:hypothetical protein
MKGFFMVMLSTLLPGCAAMTVMAQGGEPIPKTKANAPVREKDPKVKLEQPAGEKVTKILRRALPPDTPGSLSPRTILVRIRYRIELGYLELRGDAFGNKPLPSSCRAFDVSFTTISTAPATFGRAMRVGSTVQQDDQMKEDLRQEGASGFYSCWFTVSDLPLNRPIIVSGNVINDPLFLTRPWQDGKNAKPALGDQRAVGDSQTVTLTSSPPSAIVDLAMGYRRRPRPPR